jgi:hypothetical protein
MNVKKFLFPVIAAPLTSCGNTVDEYSKVPSYLVIDNSVHNDATLASAMTPHSGVYVIVTITTQNGAKYFNFKSNQGTESKTIFNAIDDGRSFILGLNKALIVGYGNSIDGIFYAYDRECPNCFDPDNLPLRSYPLTISSSGIGSCANCKRTYDLNNGGLIATGDAGEKLTRYYTSTTGPYGVLSVQ